MRRRPCRRSGPSSPPTSISRRVSTPLLLLGRVPFIFKVMPPPPLKVNGLPPPYHESHILYGKGGREPQSDRKKLGHEKSGRRRKRMTREMPEPPPAKKGKFWQSPYGGPRPNFSLSLLPHPAVCLKFCHSLLQKKGGNPDHSTILFFEEKNPLPKFSAIYVPFISRGLSNITFLVFPFCVSDCLQDERTFCETNFRYEEYCYCTYSMYLYSTLLVGTFLFFCRCWRGY